MAANTELVPQGWRCSSRSLVALTSLAMTLACSIVVPGLSGCAQKKEEASNKQEAPVKAKSERLSEQSVITSFSLTGVMDSRKSVSIFPQVTGYVARILVSPGQAVKPGQTLLELGRNREEAALAAKQSSVQLAEADYAKELGSLKSMEAERKARESEVNFQAIEYERYYWLEKRGVVPVASVDKEQRDLEVVKARLSSMEAQIAAQQGAILRAQRRIDEAKAEMLAQREQLHYYWLKSPFDGIVGDIPVKVGDFVNPQTKLTQVSENHPLEVNLQVPKDEAALVKQGTLLELQNDDGSLITRSKVFYVSPTVDMASQSVLVKGLCENSKNELRPDQSVLVKVVVSSSPGITVPTEALSYVAGQAFVFIVAQGKDGKPIAEQRPVTITDIHNNRATISEGLKKSDEILVSGIQLLADGTPLELQGRNNVH